MLERSCEKEVMNCFVKPKVAILVWNTYIKQISQNLPEKLVG